ncbi:alpha-amylase family glycosyl hydrolase [Ornithinimicrobium tianjinense]|uniref:1,4-alpha-glucan branching enzyme n=1 Tax=Ornithinimicrobium tianjinense TaxID=1195761 RepID=A0A917BWW3_9MICO|nr:alpha-amylase family glycosyl hydrolase [Ornithinimicrobium tianjinense]GGF60512.1 1,4-alpha-glucan branching enzyme [Ornithinimicrobium tianjinense]
MGAIPFDGGFAFRVWAPNADAVHVVGDFNGWDDQAHALQHEGNGHWYGEVHGAAHGNEYQFLLTVGEHRFLRIDPRAQVVTNSVGNGILYDHGRFDWQADDQFVTPGQHELVIYETHIGSFVPSGDGGPADLHDLTGKLDYLVGLGVNAVELMPLMEFAGDYSWGYNPAHIFAVERTYGGPEALKAFVREAHRHGIAVIVDVVYNHFGPSDLSIWQFDGWSENGKGGIYFYNDERSSTPWGDTRPDYGRPEVRSFILDNARMWLRDYHVDGLRLDMTPYMRTIDGFSGDIPEGWAMMRLIGEMVRTEFPGRLVIAEDLHNDAAVTAVGDGGAAMHAQWDNQFVHPVREALITPADEHRSIPAVAQAVMHRYHHAFDRVIYTESHDEVANGKARITSEVRGDNPSGWDAQKRATLGAALVLTAPGMPMLFQGQEFLEDEWFRDNVPLDWERAWAFREITQMFRDLIRMRRNLDGDTAGLSGPNTTLVTLDDDANVIAYVRSTDDGRHVLVALNLTAHAVQREVQLPGGYWKVRFNSDARAYSSLFGDHATPDLDARDGHAVLDLGPYSSVVFVPA